MDSAKFGNPSIFNRKGRHHPLIFMFEVVAMDHIRLSPGEGLRKINGQGYFFARPDNNGIDESEILWRESIGCRDKPAKDGNDYNFSCLQGIDLHKIQHKIGGY